MKSFVVQHFVILADLQTFDLASYFLYLQRDK
jgi:hypothetical protein